jgi:hypothetical protein
MASQPAASPSPDLGPSKVASPSNPFALNTEEMQELQTWMFFAQELPGTDDELRLFLGVDQSFDISGYEDLVTAFQPVTQHAVYWADTLLPSLVALAADLVSYGTLAQSALPALKGLIPPQGKSMDPTAAQNFLQTIQYMQSQASTCQQNASARYQDLQTFAATLQADQKSVSDTLTSYQQRLSGEGGEIQQLQNDLTSWQSDLSEAQAKYRHDVIVASTSPSYAWVGFPICPVGLIAAGIVSGIYGARAKQAAAEIAADKQNIRNDEKQLANDKLTMAALTNATNGLTTLLTDLVAVTGVIQTMEGGWDAIAGDLSSLAATLQSSETAPGFLQGIDFDTATKDWANVVAAAQSYQSIAFVSVTGSAQSS